MIFVYIMKYKEKSMKETENTLKNKIYEALFSDIINGKYPPDTILTEKFLMDKYQVSRAPIREALTQLTATSVLSSIPRQGYKIYEPDSIQLLEICKFRSAMESSFLRSCRSYISKRDVQDLRQLCHENSSGSADDFIPHWHSNCKFHLQLFSYYQNDYAYKLLKESLQIQTIFFTHKKTAIKQDLHLALLDYIEKDDLTTATTILKADIENLLLPSFLLPSRE